MQEFCNKWRLKSNIKKSAVMVYSKEAVKGTYTWKWGDNSKGRKLLLLEH